MKFINRLMVGFFLFLAGCTADAQGTQELQDPFVKASEALSVVSSVHIHSTFYEISGSGSRTLSLTMEAQYTFDQTETIQIQEDWGDGLLVRYFCQGPIRNRQCWSKVGMHPWTVRIDLTSLPLFLEQRQEEFSESEILRMEDLLESNQLIIDWKRSIVPGIVTGDRPGEAASPGNVETGQSWLQASTYLPLREVITGHSAEEQTEYEIEVVYSGYNAPASLEMPVVATVTPLPTLPAPAQTPATGKEVREEQPQFPGIFYLPEGPGPFIGIILLHGSEGGISGTSETARQLAKNGFAALALCYYGCPQTPSTLVDIQTESVMQAVDYLKNNPEIRPGSLALLGISRGAELALITGVLDEDVKAVISVMGTPWVNEGYPLGGTAWLYQGHPLPFQKIPVEQIQGPILLIHGERDAVWAVEGAYLLADRLDAHGHPYELAVYPERGHDIGLYPQDAFNRIINFLREVFP